MTQCRDAMEPIGQHSVSDASYLRKPLGKCGVSKRRNQWFPSSAFWPRLSQLRRVGFGRFLDVCVARGLQ